jgi:hypothetical protein
VTPRRAHVTAITLTAVLLLALSLRVWRILTLFPILVDESIYLRWAEIIEHQGQWFVSLLDAKQPLSYWLYALLRIVLPDVDPLLSARCVSAVAGTVSCALLFAIGRRMAGAGAGLAAALFYAVLPYGVFYDHLAYTDALVNCFAMAVTLASLICFAEDPPKKSKAVIAGAILGLGLFTKTSLLPFVLVPLLLAAPAARRDAARTIRALALLFAVAAVPPLLSYFFVPEAPTFAVNDLVLHHTSFFTPFAVLLHDPLINVPRNSALLLDYLARYATAAFAIASLAALLYLAWIRHRLAALVAVASLLPFALQALMLAYFPSRYAFPHVWPLLLATAVALSRIASSARRMILGAAVLCVPLLLGTRELLSPPHTRLNFIDHAEFLSSGPFSGYGIREAVAYLKKSGPMVLLTDPIWGTPADAFYPYLNHRHDIRVYDAWWTQLSDREPLLPRGRREVMKSQYERVSAGFVDFDRISRVFYVTDTNYHTPADVLLRAPRAKPVVRFVKPNGIDSIDVYRLR